MDYYELYLRALPLAAALALIYQMVCTTFIFLSACLVSYHKSFGDQGDQECIELSRKLIAKHERRNRLRKLFYVVVPPLTPIVAYFTFGGVWWGLAAITAILMEAAFAFVWQLLKHTTPKDA